VEIGACGGVSGLWLARGLAPRGVLTSVEGDPYAHGLASEAFEGAGTAERVRCIQGEPATVLPRLSDGGYDLVLLQGRAADYPDHLAHARRLLRAGGLLIARRVLRRGEDSGGALARFLDSPRRGPGGLHHRRARPRRRDGAGDPTRRRRGEGA
jgi:predicted O-methyltransferase YrrM